MAEPHWISVKVALALHARQVAEHGGDSAVREFELLASAIAKPQQRLHDEPTSTLFQLAAAYASGIAKNHPFVDGNKRTAFVVYRLFLLRNGFTLSASKTERYLSMLQLASGERSEDEFAQWLSDNTSPIA
ncbi:type II toxin-antitoxin system death-on-curing family toxin [Haloferula chungangensis]|uniref:Type II toxin-antitoxin system death-on-curing family toxin n=1 Tax=Haloferula chungangensis TaxID=1048331 RepID=A0ABW2L6H1_9BACT